MDKQQAAEAFIEKMPVRDKTVAYHSHMSGWEAHEAHQSAKTVETICSDCNGNGFIEVDTRQADGTYQIDCEFCYTKGKHTLSVPAAQQSPGDAVDFLRWLYDNKYLEKYSRWFRGVDGSFMTATGDELYKLFNPSGEDRQPGDRFIQGYACAVANLCRLNGEADTHTHEMFRDGLGKMANLKGAGVDDSDMEILKKYFK